MYPPIEPSRSGWADVGNGHHIYWEECGNPQGRPAVVLHGGPGSGCTPNNRRYFAPDAYRIVLFDQRNSGRSRPHASEPWVDLSANTTHHLVEDIEFIRTMLGIEQWLVMGASWGSALALAYAEKYPSHVSELILVSATTGRRAETDLLTTGLGHIFRDSWARLVSFAERDEGQGGILDKMHRLLFSPNPAVREQAAVEWCAWETAILPTASSPSPRFESAEFRLAFARLVTHYWRHGSWLEEGALLAGAGVLADIPGAILQGSLDLGNLSGTPWQLSAALPKLELIFIDDAGHKGSQTFSQALLSFTDRLVGR